MAFADLLESTDSVVRSTLGSAIVYSPSAGADVEVQGIFDAAYLRVDAGQAGVTSCGPAVFVTLADLPNDPDDDTGAVITVAGVEYEIQEIQKDGMGAARLLLHRI